MAKLSGVPILCYHSVHADWQSPLAVAPDDFDRQCEWLRRHRTVVDLDTAVRLASRSGRLPRRTVALTFDDGFADNLETALPILRRHGLPAAMFIVADTLTGGHPVDWVDDPPAFSLRTLTLEQTRQLAAAGMTIGSHTMTHRTQTELTVDVCRRDLVESRRMLEDLLDVPITYLAYPRGRHNRAVRAAAEAAGYTHSFALPTGPETVTEHSLPRVGVYRNNTGIKFRAKTSRSYLPLRTSRLYARLTSRSPSADAG